MTVLMTPSIEYCMVLGSVNASKSKSAGMTERKEGHVQVIRFSLVQGLLNAAIRNMVSLNEFLSEVARSPWSGDSSGSTVQWSAAATSESFSATRFSQPELPQRR